MSRVLVRISKLGRVEPFSMEEWLKAIEPLRGNPHVWLEFSKVEDKRSNQANARWWGVTIPVVQEFLSRGREIPLSKDQAHYAVVCAFAGSEAIDEKLLPGGPPVPVPTRTMSKAQFSEMMERVEAYFISEHGLTFPEEIGIG